MKSYIEFSLIGAYCEEFISEVMKSQYRIYDISNIDGVLYGKISPNGYKKIARLTHKYKVRMRIVKKEGVQIRIIPYKKRYGIVLGAISYAIVILICSSFIWDIRITGNVKLSDDQILKALSTFGINAGANPDSFESGSVEFKMKLELDDLSWISVEKEGARVNVRVNERVIPNNEALSVDTLCNIIAKKTGIIVRTEIYRGKMLYPIGSAVREGDVIVSGVIEDTAGNNQYVNSSGKVYAQFEETAEFSMPLTSFETVRTGKITTDSYIKFFSFTFPQREVSAIENFEYEEDTYNVNILGLNMPWKIKKIVGYETKQQQITRTINDVKKLLERQLEQYEKNIYSKMTIVSSEKEYNFKDGILILNVKYTLEDDIAVQKEFSIN